MRQLTRRRTTTRFRGLAHRRGVLAGVTLLTLVLVMFGLLLSTLGVSAAPSRAGAGQAADASPLQARPTHKPKPTHTPRPTPTPTATLAPSPTAIPTEKPTAAPTTAPTAAPTETASPVTVGGGHSGPGDGDTQAGAAPPGWLLGWGVGILMVALLGFSVFLVLFTRRAAREPQQPAFPPPPQKPARARLNQLRQMLPARHAAPPAAAGEAAAPTLGEGYTWEPLPPLHEAPVSPPLKPPPWMIEAGLMKEDTGELPAADLWKPQGERKDADWPH